ncbi:MAG: hypothetical protein V4717_01765 [Bacteroidota bacterium]
MNILLNSCMVMLLYMNFFVCNNSECESREQTGENSTQDSLVIIAGKLDKAFNTHNVSGFFELFPAIFSQFELLYGYDDKKGEGILYKKYQDHIGFLCDNGNISEKDKLNKLINIGVDGRWDADAVAMLQKCTLDLIKNNVQASVKILNGLSKSETMKFWAYLFDGPHPNDKENTKSFNNLKQSVEKIDSNQAMLMEQAFKKISVE